MTALKHLWRRAPQWRVMVYTMVLFAAMSLLFPMPWMMERAPWLARLPGIQPLENRGSQAPSTQTPAGQDDEKDGADRLITPDITSSLVGSIPLGGHTLPLPAGTWHPVLAGQYGPGGHMLVNILARTDRGIVTGIMIARSTTEQVPLDVVEEAMGHCHDDRNYTSHIFSERSDGQSECYFISNAIVGPNGALTTDEIILTALKRLYALGFPMPSLFVVASWIKSSGTTNVIKGGTSVTYLLSPSRTGTVQLLAPLPYWNKSAISRAPAAGAFIRQTDLWMKRWVPLLRSKMMSDADTAPVPNEWARDPAAP